MARRSRTPLVPESRPALDQLKAKVMKEVGYAVDPSQPEAVKYEVAKGMNVPMQKDYNGQLTAKQAGTVGGQIGGRMVSELIRQAKQHLNKQH
ncbi:alpha/beta-type small acid-soluble spore protein [Fictibacillus enclensis]|uniref:alpha/beta-type small acid-soluble spore protein n=1 Tax=Fictibacillus enclensis TaxID=1017270 RepID=UPI0025A013CB|nr:alpha/beta-type small acid-soluble spore protein [Fictibacillus enclensis]MDM5201485.1 alpha/beta-type small acid-soluble spore protein [Fictibacillus enclensis]MDM5340901.1 alpha/beta-type small acid-soluble spore protein [Fictibacillus enclensis]